MNEELNEPSDICLLGSTLLIADTNHHNIVPIEISDEILKVSK